MMGLTHSTSGTTAWAAAAAVAPLAGIHPHLPAIIAGSLTTAGAALLPDIDHPEATIAFTFGPVSKVAAEYVHRVSGGHRHATHSFAFAGSVFAATWLGVASAGPVFALPVLFVLFAFAIRALKLARGALLTVTVLITVGAAAALNGDYGWLPVAVGLGSLTHLAGDCLTREGCPLLWPHRGHYMLPVIRRTGNDVERWLFAPGFAVATLALLAVQGR